MKRAQPSLEHGPAPRERPDLPIVVLSAGIRASPPTGVPFVAKPFDAELLLATVARLLVA
jgi:hypothetical protein